MNKQNQNGSALVVVTIILVIAIIGALGFVVWKNYLQPKPDVVTTQTDTTKTEPIIKSKTAQIDTSFPTDLSWTYPENWTIKSEGGGPRQPSDTVSQKFTLLSPSNKYEVIYMVGLNVGIGGTCEPGGDDLQLVRRSAVPNFEKSVFMETIRETPEGFSYLSSLFENDNNVMTVNQGDSFCNIDLRNIIPLTDDGSMVILAAEINIKQFDSFDQYGPTEIHPGDITAIKKSFEDPEYKDAVKILLSTTSH